MKKQGLKPFLLFPVRTSVQGSLCPVGPLALRLEACSSAVADLFCVKMSVFGSGTRISRERGWSHTFLRVSRERGWGPWRFAYFSRKGLGPMAVCVFLEKGAGRCQIEEH